MKGLAWMPLAGLLLAGQAGATLIDRNNGLIYDTLNNVSWTADAGLSSGWRNWDAQSAFAANFTLAGFDDFRLPTVAEFFGLYDQLPGSGDKRGDVGPFVNIGGDYWTANVPTPPGEEMARLFDFVDGRDYGALKGGPYLGWAVRTGDSAGAFLFDLPTFRFARTVPELGTFWMGILAWLAVWLCRRMAAA